MAITKKKQYNKINHLKRTICETGKYQIKLSNKNKILAGESIHHYN